ncbi:MULTISPECIES: hypothetical protein [Streptomyces]|uniref:hypothetical protein n=1 Tax=Streptomyces TaxID=1883 RepID=UPI001318C78A|nr:MULTISPECIES: hypothetical protein [Streptomyces]QGZ52021.1 hypothetical protein GPZ77_29920 [Streptomyces sp. QHH-9511]GGT72630.1 hypothetical protein GCM10010272_14780 [Streptomyces lateritius]
MRAIRAASTALLGAAALALAVPVAGAADGAPAPHPQGPQAARAKAPGDFVVSPSLVAPGGRVTLSAPGCRSTATASSGVFDTVTIAPGSSATAVVDWDARRGAVYTVNFNCTGGVTDTVNLTISGTTASPTSPTATSTVLTPPRGVQGGLGGSVGGVEAWTLAAGTGLVITATTGLVLVLRRRSNLDRGRRH